MPPLVGFRSRTCEVNSIRRSPRLGVNQNSERPHTLPGNQVCVPYSCPLCREGEKVQDGGSIWRESGFSLSSVARYGIQLVRGVYRARYLYVAREQKKHLPERQTFRSVLTIFFKLILYPFCFFVSRSLAAARSPPPAQLS